MRKILVPSEIPTIIWTKDGSKLADGCDMRSISLECSAVVLLLLVLGVQLSFFVLALLWACWVISGVLFSDVCLTQLGCGAWFFIALFVRLCFVRVT